MADNTAKEIYYLLPNGKYPNCKKQIRVIDSEFTLYKIRFLKIVKNNKPMINCPNCKNMIIVD